MNRFASQRVDIALLDLNHYQGIAMFDELRQAAPDLLIVFVIGADEPATTALEKGLNQTLPRTFRHAIERARRRTELSR